MKIRRAVLFYSRYVISLLIFSLMVSGSVFGKLLQCETLSGNLTDASHRVIAGAHIVVTSRGAASSTPPVAETDSHEDGSFKLSVAPGQYRVTITRDAFVKVERDVTVTADKQTEINLQLEIAPLSASVVVTAQPFPIETTSTPARVDVVTHEQIVAQETLSLPDLLSTFPGISLARTGREGGQATLFMDGAKFQSRKSFDRRSTCKRFWWVYRCFQFDAR